MSETAEIRHILARHGRLAVPVSDLADDSDLYYAGLSSQATVGVMLALEDHFDVEFPTAMLGRKTFQSIDSMAVAIAALLARSLSPLST